MLLFIGIVNYILKCMINIPRKHKTTNFYLKPIEKPKNTQASEKLTQYKQIIRLRILTNDRHRKINYNQFFTVPQGILEDELLQFVLYLNATDCHAVKRFLETTHYNY